MTLRRRHARSASQRGLSLVELFVALVLGLAVIGGALVYHLASLRASRHTQALARMTEDARLALALIGRDIRLAGHPQVSGKNATGGFAVALRFPPVTGCDKGFTDPKAAVLATSCNPGSGTGSPALAVNFLATNDILPTSSGAEPLDCRGARINDKNVTSNGATASGRYTSHRYYVDTPSGSSTPSLYCATPNGQASTSGSPPAGGTEPLVPNVTAIRLRYGESPDWTAADPATHRVQRWISAGDVTQWDQVVAVEVCLLMQSDAAVLSSEDTWKYRDCDDVSLTSTDRRLYRAYRSTQLIRNRGSW